MGMGSSKIHKYLSCSANLHRVFFIPLLLPIGLGTIIFSADLRHLVPKDTNYLTGIFFGNDGLHFSWPFFPWFGTMCLGYYFIYLHQKLKDPNLANLITWCLGVFCILIFFLIDPKGATPDPIHFWKAIFQPDPNIFLLMIGLYLVILSFCLQIAKYLPPRPKGIRDCFSQGILPIYSLHLIMGHKLSFFLLENLALPSPLAALILILATFFCGWILGYYAIVLLKEKRLRIKIQKTLPANKGVPESGE